MTDRPGPPPTSATNPAAPAVPAPAATAVQLSSLLLAQLADLLAGLDPRTADDLVAGRARLTLSAHDLGAAPDPTRGPAAATPSPTTVAPSPISTVSSPQRRAAGSEVVDVEALRSALLAATSREEATAHLAGLGRLTVPRLRALAVALGVEDMGNRDPKATVIRKIVDQTVGFRLSARAMHVGDP